MQSKLLTYLGIDEAQAEKLPNNIKELVKLIDGSQKLFSESPDNPKKQVLAKFIVAKNRELMEYLQKNNYGIYVQNNVEQEKSNLPKESGQEKQIKEQAQIKEKVRKMVSQPQPQPMPEPEPEPEPKDAAKEYKEKRQALDEFFTPLWVAEIMYLLAVKHGFSGGKVCEPSFGKGVFFDVLVANGIKEEDLFGFEIYKPNFDFVKEKYPNATLIDHNFEYEFAKDDKALRRDGVIINEEFKKTEFDLFIGNPPYGSHKSPYSYLFDKDAQVRYEGFFILLALQQLKKGGLCVFIINSLWLNNGNMYNKQKEMIAKYGELIDAYRLPNNIFKGENRDTSIATDIVVFKKF